MFESADDIIKNRLGDNWTATEIDYDNVEFTPVRGTPFIRLQIEWSNNELTSIGGRAKGEGYIDLSIFVPANTGTNPAAIMADTLAALFNRYKEGALVFKVARIMRIGNNNQWYQVKVIVPFTYDECQSPQLGYGSIAGYGV